MSHGSLEITFGVPLIFTILLPSSSRTTEQESIGTALSGKKQLVVKMVLNVNCIAFYV